jgi:hypothetical protein
VRFEEEEGSGVKNGELKKEEGTGLGGSYVSGRKKHVWEEGMKVGGRTQVEKRDAGKLKGCKWEEVMPVGRRDASGEKR